ATIVLPLSFATDLDLQIRLRAFPLPGEPQTVTVDTGLARVGPFAVGTAWQTVVAAIPRAAWRAGANQVVLTFSRVGRPSSAVGGGFSLVDVFWSSRGGLLATSPAVYVGVLGWIVLWRVDRTIATAGLALLAVSAVLVSSRAAWWTGAWPSPAAFLALTPYVV